MTYRDFQRTATGFSRGMVVVGGIIMLVCVAMLTVYWWQQHRWVWVGMGIVLIVVDVGMVALTFRKAKLSPPGKAQPGKPPSD